MHKLKVNALLVIPLFLILCLEKRHTLMEMKQIKSSIVKNGSKQGKHIHNKHMVIVWGNNYNNKYMHFVHSVIKTLP